MELESMDLVASLQALPETDPIEGIQFWSGGGNKKPPPGGGGNRTCQSACVAALTIQVNTVCVIVATCV
jgi:hypothetical protein